jgi:putative endonuclease
MELLYGIYILKCSNSKHYTGFTTNIKNRLKAHRKGEVSFTKDKLPIKLLQISYFEKKKKAYDFERYLKSGSGIAFRNKRLI